MKKIILILGFIFGLILYFTYHHCNNKKISELSIKVMDNGYVYVPLIFEKDTLFFLFDTGAANTSVLNYGNKRDVEGKPMHVIPLNSHEPSVNTLKYDNVNFQLGDFNFKESFLTWDNTIKTNILGMNIISQFYWDFNFEKETVRVSKYSFEILENPECILNYYLHDQIKFPMVNIDINNNITFKMVYDTGLDSDAFILFEDFSYSDSTLLRHKKNDFFFSSHSSNDGSASYRWLTDSLSIDGYLVEEVMFMFISDNRTVESRRDRGVSGNIPTLNRDFKRVYMNPFDKQILFYDKIDGGLLDAMKNSNNIIREHVKRYMIEKNVKN